MRQNASYIDAMRVARTTMIALVASAALVGSGSTVGAQQEAPEADDTPRCFGAASRDPVDPCRNARLARMVKPKPIDALLEANSECKFGDRKGELSPCHFGVPEETASETVALIGDSHAAHWRAAIDTVVAAKNWHGISMTKAGCPFSTAMTDLAEPGKTKCIRWKRQLFRWFAEHPEIKTVITSNHSGGKVVGKGPAASHRAHVKGYAGAMQNLLATVEHVMAIRDVPRNTKNSSSCVDRAIRKKQNAGPACAVPRDFALKPDPAVGAVKRLDPSRVQLIDMTRFMCSSRLCMPVIGGALVHKDQTHLTRVFAMTLGPFLLRHVERAFTFFGQR